MISVINIHIYFAIDYSEILAQRRRALGTATMAMSDQLSKVSIL